MLKSFFKIFFRNLWRNKTFSFINISGLTIGLAVFIIIMLWVRNELSYDRFHKNNDRIAAVMTNQSFGNDEIATFPAVPSLLAAAMTKDLPGVESAATSSWGDNRQFSVNDKNFIEYGLYVSPEFLHVFTFPLLKGPVENALQEPNTILITEKLAKKYFGNQEPIGKFITFEQTASYKVEGVLKNIPENATLTFDFLMPVKDYINWANGGKESWEINNMRSYVKLKEGVNREQFNDSLKTFLRKYTDKQSNSELILWNLNDWYLRFDFKDGKYAGGGRITYVKLFVVIAIFILLLACINFMNLSTARATQRAKEVGVRKVIGAGRKELVKHFIGESLLLSGLAGLAALTLVSLALPVFNIFLRKHITIDYSDTESILLFLIIILTTGLLAGSYPSFVLASFKPISVLKNMATNSSVSTVWVRKVLVVTQFSISVLLIIGTIVVSKQINYIRNRELGYNKDHLIWFPNNIAAEKNEIAIQEFLRVPGVTHAAQASMTFTMANNRGAEVKWPGKSVNQEIFFSFIAGSIDIIGTMGLTMSEGRPFSANYSTDTSAYILNEEAVKRMGLKNPVGKVLETYGGKGTIVGIVKDFHFESLHNPIAPAIISCRPNWTWLMYVRVDGKHMEETLKGVETVYKSMAPGFVFDYNFQDKEYERLYRSELQIGTLVNWFAFFAIFISCLGLLGLTIYTVERKTREIGIRKVLGASVASIIALVSKQFIWLILLAIAIAMLPAYFFMKTWLQNYAYRTSLNWWIFGMAGGIVLLIALLTVCIMSIKAAISNPVSTLRSE